MDDEHRAVDQKTRTLNEREGVRAVPGSYSEIEYTECHTNGVRTLTREGRPCKGRVNKVGRCFAHEW